MGGVSEMVCSECGKETSDLYSYNNVTLCYECYCKALKECKSGVVSNKKIKIL